MEKKGEQVPILTSRDFSRSNTAESYSSSGDMHIHEDELRLQRYKRIYISIDIDSSRIQRCIRTAYSDFITLKIDA